MRFEEDYRFEVNSIFVLCRHLVFVLAENKRLQDTPVQIEIGLDDDNILRKAIVPELEQIVTVNDFVPVFSPPSQAFRSRGWQ